MKKSVFTFRFLASSLVMLTVTPFFDNNPFLSNSAMAQEYDKYRDSPYSQYATEDKNMSAKQAL